MLPWRCPVYRRRELVAGAGMEQENLSSRYERPVEMGEVGPLVVKKENPTGRRPVGENTRCEARGRTARSSDEGPVIGPERRGQAGQVNHRSTLRGRS